MDDDMIEFSDTVFIGAVDYNMTEEEFIEEVMAWGNVIKTYYRGPTFGWGTATFVSSKARNDFLEKKRSETYFRVTFFALSSYFQPLLL